MKITWFACGLALLLSGCSSLRGIESSSALQETFQVDAPYDVVMKRAQAQADYCLRGITQYPVIVSSDATKRQSQLRVIDTIAGSSWAKIDAVSTTGQSSEVTMIMAGVSLWDQSAMRAMRAAIEFGLPSCKDYMPAAEPKSVKK